MIKGWEWDRRHMRWLGSDRKVNKWTSWRPVVLWRRRGWVAAVSGIEVGLFHERSAAMDATESWMRERGWGS